MTAHHPAEIYEHKNEGRFYSPFSLQSDPMERLILVNFQGDPDEHFIAFEPQVFDDPFTGSGMIVLAYLHDGTFDVYHQPGMDLSGKDYDIVGNGLNETIETEFEAAIFDIGRQGVDLHIAFRDKHGREVDVRILERSRKPRKPFPLLAPFPSAAEKPPALPVVTLYDFYFVRRADTQIEVRIDGALHRPDKLPAPVDLSWMYFVRYSPDPATWNLNPNYDGPLPALDVQGPGALEHGDLAHELVENDGRLEIAELRPADTEKNRMALRGHSLNWRFDPPFPDLSALRDGAQAGGDFALHFDGDMGKLPGTYHVSRQGGRVTLELHPGGGWQPTIDKCSVRVMFALVPVFKRWPKTYRWTAELDLHGDAPAHLRSRWTRITQK